MEQWLSDNKLPLGRWIKNGVDVLLDNGAYLFDAFADAHLSGFPSADKNKDIGFEMKSEPGGRVMARVSYTF